MKKVPWLVFAYLDFDLPSVCVTYVKKCMLFTRNWVKSKVAKSKFYLLKNSKRKRTCGKFTISSTKFHVNFFLWCWIMRLEYVIKCRLFTRKWHVTERGPIWRNGIWLVEYNSSTWKIVQCSCRAMVWYVLIGL